MTGIFIAALQMLLLITAGLQIRQDGDDRYFYCRITNAFTHYCRIANPTGRGTGGVPSLRCAAFGMTGAR